MYTDALNCMRTLVPLRIRKLIFLSGAGAKALFRPPFGIHTQFSTVDMWTFILSSSHRGETITILTMGKDGFAVNKTQFTKLNAQIYCRGVTIQLTIYHNGESQRKSGASLLGWTPSSNRNDKFYQEFDFSTLGRYIRGLPNGQDPRYLNYAQELLDKQRKRELLGAAQSAFTSVNDRVNRSRKTRYYQMSSPQSPFQHAQYTLRRQIYDGT